jgi:hypothetical protein
MRLPTATGWRFSSPSNPPPRGKLRRRLADVTQAGDTRALIEMAVHRFLAEVPALEPLKLVVGLELRGRGDTQHYRVEMPGPVVSKGVAADARVHVEVPRARFNELAEKGTVADWRQAVARGELKATGPDQILRLVGQVVERQEERSRTRRARH